MLNKKEQNKKKAMSGNDQMKTKEKCKIPKNKLKIN